MENDVALAEIRDSGNPWQAYLDPVTAGELVVRSRRPGERFQPLGMNGRRARVKEVMINEKIPARLRPRWPLVANDQNLLWLVGHRLDRRARVTPTTTAVIHLRCYRVGT